MKKVTAYEFNGHLYRNKEEVIKYKKQRFISNYVHKKHNGYLSSFQLLKDLDWLQEELNKIAEEFNETDTHSMS